MALAAAACLVLIITGAALSGRFFRMGRSSNTSASGSSQAADTGGAYIMHEGTTTTEAAEEEAGTGEVPADVPAEDGTAFDTAANEDAADRLAGFASFTVLAGGETYEGEDAAAVVDEFFDSGPSDEVLTLTVVFPEGDEYSVQLWHRGETAVCSINEDGVAVRSLDDLLAYFRV